MLLIVTGILINIVGPIIVSFHSDEILFFLSPDRYDRSWEYTLVNSLFPTTGILVIIAGLYILISNWLKQVNTLSANISAMLDNFETESIRNLLIAAFNDTELMSLCFDRFYPVYNERFGSGMGKGEKVQQLLDYCVHHGKLEALLELIRERNPHQYAVYIKRTRT
jgi:hypothetical protein